MFLAINGGAALRDENHAEWPIWNDESNQYVSQVIASKRWSVRGAFTGEATQELEFANEFAQYHHSQHCVLTTSGSTGLLMALEALDMSHGAEVIVPALTWIAPFTAVLNAGLIPVMVDVEKVTTCISPEQIRQAITPKTKAIIVVHLHCSIANMDAIGTIAREHNLYVIEDCCQACGAMWGNNYVGTMGDIGVFSFNQEKTLTCGEGGAVLTNQTELYEKLFRTKTDGCNFDQSRQIYGEDQLNYDSGWMGSNFCISEFQAAILRGQLAVFVKEHRTRQKNAAYLDQCLANIAGLSPLKHHQKAASRAYYEYAVLVDCEYFANRDLATILAAVSAELQLQIHLTDLPIYRNPLFVPDTKKKYQHYVLSSHYCDLDAKNFPNCEYLYHHLAVFHHKYLLGNTDDMEWIASAFRKVQLHAKELAE
jgi:L-glutamine:2-deoxy-scyllo-inosose/3-amino-2,3-dideoxy-scyllo-inosose aminotransferase